MHKVLIAGGVALGLGGCTSSAPERTVAYVSPVIYETYTCAQLGREAERMSAETRDQARPSAGAAAIVIPWPTASLTKGNGGYANEPHQLARIERAAAAKRCAASPQPRSS